MKYNYMQQKPDKDLSLIQAVQSGDKAAFNLLVLKYQYKILKLIVSYVKDPSESLDVVQEIFIKAYKGLDNFKYKSSFYTWLYKIAINTAKSYVIDKNRYLPEYSFDVLESHDQSYYFVKNLAIEGGNLDNSIVNKELKNIFFAMINNLPEDLKKTILLREVEELTYEEIAAVMECPVGTVRSRIFRAREAIDKKIPPRLIN